MRHTSATRGGFRPSVTVTNSLSPATPPRTFDLVVAADPPTVLHVVAPATTAENAGALTITLTRSGDLSVRSDAMYELTARAGTQRMAPTSGTIGFAPGE